MANTTTNIQHKILARALLNLRETVVMPRLVNRDYGLDARKEGSTVDIPVPVAQSATAVTPAQVPPAPASKTPTIMQIPMSSWYFSDFHLTDKDQMEIARDEHFVPMQMEEAVRALAFQINGDILTEYDAVYGYVGTAGTTPFASSAADVANVRKTLNSQLCPKPMRRMVLDHDAEANAATLAQFAHAEKSADSQVVREGELGRKYGFDWFSDDQIPTHTAGTGASATTDNAGYAIGVKTVTLASAGTGTILTGDIITFAGQTQTYTVTSGDSDVSNGGTVSFEPGLKAAIPGSTTAITVKASHVVNLGFHKNAFAFVTRPLEDSNVGNLRQMATMADPVSGLVLRLQIVPEWMQTAWVLDVLYGFKCVRPEYACRLAG